MENIFGDLTTMVPVYVLFLTSGLIIYTVSSWLGEALIGQIKNRKTSVFGKTPASIDNRALYVPPAQISTVNQNIVSRPTAIQSLPVVPKNFFRP